MIEYQFDQIQERLNQYKCEYAALMGSESAKKAYSDAMKTVREHYEEDTEFKGKYGTSKEGETVKEKLLELPETAIPNIKDAKEYITAIDNSIKAVEDVLCEQKEKEYPYSKDTANRKRNADFDRYAAIREILPSSVKDEWGDYGE